MAVSFYSAPQQINPVNVPIIVHREIKNINAFFKEVSESTTQSQ